MLLKQKFQFLTLTLVLISLILHFPTGISDLASERAALLTIRAAVRGRVLLWNVSAATPCSWTGVVCDQNGVVELRLPGMGLLGQLPSGVIGNLTRLRTLSLRYNALSGRIPADIANLPELRRLYLQGNLFSGEIPAFLFRSQNLIRLNLAGNNFSGEISPNFNNLTRLVTLYLENNQLTGSIPELNLKLGQFNVSHNRLNGSIPSRFSGMPESAFEGNSLCGKPLLSCNVPVSVPVPVTVTDKGKKMSGGAIAGVVIGSVIGFFIILVVLIFLCRRKRSQITGTRDLEIAKYMGVEMAGEKREGDISSASDVYAGPAKVENKNSGNLVFFGKATRVFDLEDLLRASAEVLGKGTFGTAYKATLEMGVVVAVKRLKDVTISEDEFREKIQMVGAMEHENLVALRAYYYSRDEKLLVYDYMPVGSLSALLHGNRGSGRTPLNWETRAGISLGVAQGIAYLHSRGPANSHGNIKSSNILLTRSYEARVSDFGLAPLAGPTTAPNRIDGYRAPEVTDARKVSQKADVYSFGILLLELLTGKAPTHALLNEEGVDLPRWVQSIVREEWTGEVFDHELRRYQNVDEEEMVQLLQLAINCTAQYPDNRPSMTDVAHQIEDICRSKLQHSHHDVVNDNGLEPVSSWQTYSVDSGAPPSSVKD